MTSPLISCIVPVFNGERFLGAAIDSILAQTYSPLEVIVVDDGSTDRTANVIGSYGERVSCVRQANAGPGPARNAGIRTARGELLAFLDADDLWLPEKLARQHARFEARPELDLCVTHLQNFWEPEMAEEERRHRGGRLARPIAAYVSPTILARRTAFDRVGPFDPAIEAGWDLRWFTRARELTLCIEMLPEVLVHRRLHASNISRTQAKRSVDAHMRFIKQYLDGKRKAGPGRQ